ncbi:endonuclease/exonuclease/phosphatase family protein [Niabella drilacis]|uniref:Metal-dependent hydrolase, endonuclease/exonuclease/phosphatase family n=1 Tax=Niabella drilacis (strain DSM 25811 / CCM 8410 / CCUG 62505 / LMG 26954 / E90) TaxID=1285928 RepID=A0A1G6SLD0_NIADE|nr:endonuclease/exonuclease/phosphatase family protein [Niabella drilacis]SDD16935.1 Metal-dependent hydrolase, endonuclease/exonuclease/phosphatase family [Niabella drilacis]
MKQYLLAIMLICSSFYYAAAQQLKVATFNIRMETSADQGNLWKDRATPVANLIRYHDFDIFGTQEGFKNQLDDISERLPGYARYGKGRDDGGDKGEHSAVFYKKDRFTLLRSGDFWLSETPGKPGKGWDAKCCNRICSWVYLKDKKTGKKCYFFSVHFDHEGKVARVESARLMLKMIRDIAKNENTVLVGDFNGDRNSEWYQLLANSGILRDTYRDVKVPYENNGSFNAFGKALERSEVIDHIFITPKGKAIKWGILTDTYKGKFPSDHFPVEALIQF